MSGRKSELRPMAQSFALHVAVVALVLALGRFAPPASPPVVIDFSLEEPYAPYTEPQAPSPADVEKREERVQAAARPPAPDIPKPPEPAPALAPEEDNTEQAVDVPEKDAVPDPEKDAAPAPEAMPAPSSTASSTVSAPGRAPVSGGRLERAGVGEAGPAAKPEGGGGAPSPQEVREGYLKANFAYIRERIHRGLTYPPIARKMGWEGKVTVSFVVSRDGSIRNVRVVQSSGRAMLDRSATETVTKASPLPAPPVEAEVILPVVYKLY